ncbi:MAG TPA: hypothetical protein PKV72_02025 [Candidatus Peribacteria bacterium]|nr:hypothetical protein [Candidatus Peribacteria bacterium]
MPSSTGQGGTPVDPFAQERGPEQDDAGQDTFRDIERTPEQTVKRVLKMKFLARQKRGAISGNVETEMKNITGDTEKAIEDASGRIRGDKSRISAAEREVIGEYRRQRMIMRMVDKNYIVMDLRAKSAAGIYEPGKDQITFDDDVALSPDVQYPDILYGKHVCKHEEWHRKEQAKVFNSENIKAGNITFRLHPDLIEGQAVVKVSKENNQDAKQVAEYLRHANTYRQAAQLIGEKELDEAIKSGDILGLQDAIDGKSKEKKA